MSPLPGDYNEKLSEFDKLILIKTFRFELVQRCFSEYVLKDMGQFYVEPPPTAMNIMYKDLSNCVPMIFVLSAGADPTSQLLKFAAEMDFTDKLNSISLGQGQGPKAETFIKNACAEGQWVLL